VTVVINEFEVEPAEAAPAPAPGAAGGAAEPSPAKLARQLEELVEVRGSRAARLRAW
jgi:hypothetical protein